MVHIAHLYSHSFEVCGQILRHFLGEGCDKCALFFLCSYIYLRHKVVKLAFSRSDGYFGIKQTCRSDNLLGDNLAFFGFKVARSRADENRLINSFVEFVEVERTVIKRRGQTEAVVDKALFARVVACEHSPDLRKRNVGFVDKKQKIFREIVEQCVRRRTGSSAR